MKKWIVRLFLLFILLVAVAFGYIYQQKDILKQKAIEGLNNQLDAKIAVDGKIDITFLSTFPNVTLELNTVYVADKFNAKDTLANVKKINFTINPVSLFGESLSIKSIKLQNGFVRLKTFKDGKSNYDIVKTSKDKKSNKSASLTLEEILLKNIDVIYDNKKDKVFVEAFVANANFSGKFYKKDFNILVKLKAKAKSLKVSNTKFLSNNLLNANFDLFYNSKDKCISFKENDIDIDNNNFKVKGSVCTASNSINLKATAKGTNIENAIKLIPKDLFRLGDISGKGKYSLDVQLKNQLNKPKVLVNFQLENASVKIENFDIPITDLYTTGSYSNQLNNNLVIKEFSFKSDKSQVHGNMQIPSFKNKQMKLKLEGEVYLKFIEKLNLNNIAVQDGKMQLKDIVFDFNYRKKDSIWVATKLLGEITFKSVKGIFKEIDKPYTLEGDLKFINKKVTTNKMLLTIGNNDLNFKGSLSNALNYFQDNIFGTNDALGISGSLTSKVFNLNDFLEEKQSKQISKESKPIKLLKWLNIASSVNIKIDKLKYKKLELNTIHSKLVSNEPGLFTFKNLTAKGIGGETKGNVALRFFESKRLEVFIDAKLKKIDVSKLFSSFEEFGQNSISSKNLKGNLHADIILSMNFKNFKDFQPKDLILQTNFNLKDGELINLKSLQSLSKYLSVKQLNHIYFKDFESSVSITKEVINLKNSRIQSNLISLEMGGTHSFDNKINYALKLNLKNLLATKFKKKKTLNSDYVNNEKGGINIYISMKGTTDKPIIKLDKKSANINLKESLKNEKQNLKEIFKKDTNSKEEKNELFFENDEEEFIDFEEE